MTTYLLLTVFFGYLAGAVLYFLSFELQSEALYRPAKLVVFGSILFHGALLPSSFIQNPHFSITTLAEYLEVVSFLMIAISFAVEWRAKTRFLLLFSLPIVLVFCFLAVLLAHQKQPAALMTHLPGWLWIHTGLILSGFTSLIVSVSSALMYLLQSAQLKSKHPGPAFLKLPSLDTLDRLHCVSLSAGVVLFSLGIASGFIWARQMKEFLEILKDPKVSLSFLTCLMYWTILSFRLSALRRGQKIAMGTVFIFIFLFITLLSSIYAPSGFHRGF